MGTNKRIKKKNRIMAIIVVLAAIIALVTIIVFLVIDEDVIKPRTLSAYNVRFSDAGNIEDRF